MNVPRELIEKAKEKLGDRNFELIMDGFGVKDFDSVHKRCCCPIHAENTPSFIFSPKTNSCHCFGACGRNYDVIDASGTHIYAGRSKAV